jgi:DNA-binding beta-propeller fold protein YncE
MHTIKSFCPHKRGSIARGMTVSVLALNSAVVLAAPFAYVPEAGKSNGDLSNFFVRVDLATQATTPAAPIQVVNNPTADPRTVFTGVAVNEATGQLFIADKGNAKGVLQVDTRNITNATASLPTKAYITGGDPKSVTVDRSGRHVFVATDDGQTITVVDTSLSGAAAVKDVDFQTTSAPSGPAPADVELNLSGTVAYVSDQSVDQRVCRFNAVSPPFATGIPDSDCVAAGASLPGENEFGSAQLNKLAVSPDGTRVYVLGHGDNSISVIDATKSPMQLVGGRGVLPGTGNMNGIAIDHTGKVAYVTNNLGHLYTISLTNLENGQPSIIRDLAPGTLGQMQGVSISPDGKSLLVADATISGFHIIDLTGPLTAANPMIKDIAVPGGSVAYGQFTIPDDRIFVSEFGVMAAGG